MYQVGDKVLIIDKWVYDMDACPGMSQMEMFCGTEMTIAEDCCAGRYRMLECSRCWTWLDEMFVEKTLQAKPRKKTMRMPNI